MDFDGSTFEPDQDEQRLTGQFERVMDHMKDGAWHRLKELAQSVDGTEAAVSARLRDLRKPRFGQYVVDRRRVPGLSGLWEYRLPLGQTPRFDSTSILSTPVSLMDPTVAELRMAVTELRALYLKQGQFSPALLKVCGWLAKKAQ